MARSLPVENLLPQNVGLIINYLVNYRQGLGTCDALFCVSHTLQSALESGRSSLPALHCQPFLIITIILAEI